MGDKSQALIHLKGLREMITLRGGFSAFENSPRTEMQICWYDSFSHSFSKKSG
jgi:hypothetical protein